MSDETGGSVDEGRRLLRLLRQVPAGISTSRWPDTVLDRSIVVRLQRKRPGEVVERLRPRKLTAELEQLRSELARWGTEHVEELRELEPEFVDSLDERSDANAVVSSRCC